jgi:hypothetical protein
VGRVEIKPGPVVEEDMFDCLLKQVRHQGRDSSVIQNLFAIHNRLMNREEELKNLDSNWEN